MSALPVTARTKVRPRTPEGFRAIDEPLKPETIGAARGPIYEGAQLFYKQECENYHSVEGPRRIP